MNKELQKDVIRKILKSKNSTIDWDVFDLDAEVDGSLTLPENIERMKTKGIIETDFDMVEDEIIEFKKTQNEYNENLVNEETNKEIQNVLKGKSKIIDDIYYNLRQYINVLVQGNASSLIAKGEFGLGKSYQITKALQMNNLKLGVDYEVISAYTTPLALYYDLYEANEKGVKVVVFDDVSGIVSNKTCLGILNSAMWGIPNRIVQYHSTSKTLDVPSKFICKPKIIMSMNEMPNNPTVNAMKSRALFVEVELNYRDKLKIMAEIVKKPYNELNIEERKKIYNHIKKFSSPATEDFSLRTLIKSYQIYEYYKKDTDLNWKGLVNNLLKADERLVVIEEAKNEFPDDTKRQVGYFKEKTGQSRATFFRLSHGLTK